MSAHEAFVKELRTPYRRYIRKLKAEQCRKIKKPLLSNVSPEAHAEIMKELEAKYDELFGTSDDD